MPGARTDFQDMVGGKQVELLGQACFELGGKHALTLRQRNLGVHEGEAAQARRHEALACDGFERSQHPRLHDIPGSDLLGNHVEARLLGGVLAKFGGHATVSSG